MGVVLSLSQTTHKRVSGASCAKARGGGGSNIDPHRDQCEELPCFCFARLGDCWDCYTLKGQFYMLRGLFGLLHAKGTVLHTHGTVGIVLHIEGIVLHAQGTVGTVLHAQGTVLHTRGTVSHAQGNVS